MLIKIYILLYLISYSINSFSTSYITQQKCKCLFKQTLQHSVLENLRLLVEQNKFTISRNLYNYFTILHSKFKKDLMSLNASHVWLDAGAGLAMAQIDYHNAAHGIIPIKYIKNFIKYIKKKSAKEGIAKTIAVSLNQPKDNILLNQHIANNNITYIESDIVALIPHFIDFESVDVITDVYGPLMYSSFDKILESYLDMLKKGGRLYFITPDIIIKIEKNPPKTLDLIEYLKMIKGINIKYSFLANNHILNRTFIITKTISGHIATPKLKLKFSHMYHYGPKLIYNLID